MILPISCRRFGTPENRWMRSGNHDMSWVYHKNKLWRAMKTGDLLPWYTMIYLLGKLRFLNLMIMVYICTYIYIYIVWPLYAMVFSSMNGNMMWYHAVYRNETHDEYHAPNIKTPQAYGPLNMCKFPMFKAWFLGVLNIRGDWTYHIFMSLA